MRIRSLEIAGFKSFAQRATLVFQGGISAIVGPNGCGKSNVVDAIRWVMGEQNPRHLRGRRMDDVIFGGTQTASPSGMAEVVLTLDNSDGTAPGDFREFREIEVARRLYRSGESEYLINKVPVRLRDVLDFFLDTGIGTRGYTIVEQGAIAGIVSSRPEERRMIFEEAAGIGKYRQRRGETLSKLRSTEQNLTRVTDVLSELQRQTDSLERQARRARRHKELSAKLRDLELSVTCETYSAGELRSREIDAELEARRVAVIETEARHARLDADLETERHSHIERDRALAQSSERLYKLRSEIQSFESRFEFERREHEGLERLIAQREEEVAELEARLERSQGERVAVQQACAEADAALELQQGQLAERETRLREQREALRAGAQKRDEARTRAGERARQAAALASRRDSLAEQHADGERRRAAAETALEAAQAAGVQLDSEVARLAAESAAQSAEQERAGAELAEAQRALAAARPELAEREAEVRAQRAALGECSAVLAAVEEQERRAAARVEEIVARLPQAARDQVQGYLWRLLEVDEGLEQALEAALAAHSAAVLFSGAEAALAFLGVLRESEIGRASALVTQPAPVPSSPGFVPLGRPLAARVRAAGPLQSLMERLLRDVYVVDDLRQVIDRYGASDPPAVFVTPAGERFDRSGVMTGGRGDAEGAIRRAAEIRRRSAEQGAHAARLQELEAAAAAAAQRVEASGRSVEEARQRQHALELRGRDLDKDLQRARERVEESRRQLVRLQEESAARSAALERLARERTELEERGEIAERERAQLEAEASALAADADARAAETAVLERGLGEARVVLAELRARRDEQRASAARLAGEIDQHRSWIEQRREEVESARSRAVHLKTSSDEAEREISQRIELEAKAREEQEAIRERFEAGSARMEELEQQTRAAARERGEQQQQLATRELQLQELRMRQDQLRERMRERYSLDIASYSVPESAQQGDPEEREAELKRLRASLESLGSVHLGAIEEYEGVAERHRYLTEQKADLELSIERLQNAIARINRTSRQRFRETFDLVNRRFQELFPRMFRGGRAELQLTESEDVLEAGIEIHAQPPGKRLQSVNLLSGGEKSLTALALLLSVFSVRPSPFFLLDEVDAALDDANVGRFDALLREMADQAQFLVITHNQSSIEGADTLFGVTMEEPGLSKLVSVDLVNQDTPAAAAS